MLTMPRLTMKELASSICRPKSASHSEITGHIERESKALRRADEKSAGLRPAAPPRTHDQLNTSSSAPARL